MRKQRRAAVPFRFRLYVAGTTPNSMQALANLKALCHTHLDTRHVIEVVDVFLDPERALSEKIFMTPTLVKIAPGPPRRIVGTLSNERTVLHALEVPEAPTA